MASPGVDRSGGGTVRAAFHPARALRPLAGVFGVGLGLSALYATTGVGLVCPFRAVTGWDCPFCGGTRMGSALLHGDVAAAFAANPVALVGVTLLAVVGVLGVVEAAGGRALRVPAGLHGRLRRARPLRLLALVLVLAVVDTVLRRLF